MLGLVMKSIMKLSATKQSVKYLFDVCKNSTSFFYMKYILIISLAFILAGCTQNQRAKNFGGDFTIEAPAGKTVANMTWKGDNLWIQYHDRPENVKPVVVVFKEYSSFGLVNGTVTVIEK